MAYLPLFSGANDATPSAEIQLRPPVDPPTSRGLRVIHYLGSKNRIIDPILSAVRSVATPGATVCDLFAGSGVVSLNLSQEWDVIAVDVQEYSRVLASAVLNPPDRTVATGHAVRTAAADCALRRDLRRTLAPVLDHERNCLRNCVVGRAADLCDLLQHGSLQAVGLDSRRPTTTLTAPLRDAWTCLRAADLHTGPATVVSRHFGGVFFSWEQAIDLDALLSRVHPLDADVRDHLLAAVLAAASDVVTTVGKQFAQPIKPRNSQGGVKWHLIRQILRDRSMNVFDAFESWIRRFSRVPTPRRSHRAIRADYREVLASPTVEFDVIYADPPYTRDHYSRYYHVLETMALRDDPQVSTTLIRTGGLPRLSRGMYRADRYQSPFCIKSQAPRAFQELFTAAARRRVPLLLSYSPYGAGNRPRLLQVDELLGLARQHYKTVSCHSLEGMNHNKFNLSAKNVDADYCAEVIVACTP